MPLLRIPTPLRPYAGGVGEIPVPAGTVAAALDEMVKQHPSLQTHLFDEQGSLRAFVNLFLNEEDVRYLQGVDTELGEHDQLIIIPSIAGGSIQ
ncbi:MAG: MoaD/ThiS family protein [Anaerolineae bacterium]|nr:MoaD/ThiS family protein [Anaerolineae bacterium]